jgi:hypothetical protein
LFKSSFFEQLNRKITIKNVIANLVYRNYY